MKSLIIPRDCANIGEIREAIDVIDQEIIRLLALRHEYVKEIVKFKSSDEAAIIAQDRKELVLKQRKAWAEERGLDTGVIEQVFQVIINKNIQFQMDISNSNNQS